MPERVIDLTLELVPGLRTWWMKPPVTVLRSPLAGAVVKPLETADVSALAARGW